MFVGLFCRTTAARAKVVNDWVVEGGVLLMGYEMYRLLSLKKSFATGRKKKTKKQTGPVIIDLDEEDRQQELLKGRKTVVRGERVFLLSSWLAALAAQGNYLQIAYFWELIA